MTGRLSEIFSFNSPVVCSSFLVNAENPSVPIREASIVDDTGIFYAAYDNTIGYYAIK